MQHFDVLGERNKKVISFLWARLFGEVLKLLENWRGASFADLIQHPGFGEPGKGAPHGDENTCFATHA